MAVRRRDLNRCRDFLFSLAAPDSIQQNTVSFCFGLDFAAPARPTLEGRRIHDRSQLADAAFDWITCRSWNRGARVVRNAAGVNTLVWKRTQPERAESIDRQHEAAGRRGSALLGDGGARRRTLLSRLSHEPSGRSSWRFQSGMDRQFHFHAWPFRSPSFFTRRDKQAPLHHANSEINATVIDRRYSCHH